MSDLFATKAQLKEIVQDMASKINSAGGGGGGTTERVKVAESPVNRWLRFDPDNKKGLIIKEGTAIKRKSGVYLYFSSDTKVDLSEYISTVGEDYFVMLMNDGTIGAYPTKLTTGVCIGRFHTLCVDARADLEMIAPASPSSGLIVGGKYLVKSYSQTNDPDFYAFYNKTITAIEVSTPYDVITMEHPLKGFSAGDILPESVFCLSFHPECLVEDAMVFDKDTGVAVDIYLQSGTGFNTRSKYNAVHTINRQPLNHKNDYHVVGKRLIDMIEFSSAALGSNEKTNIEGSEDKTTVGGHVDTAGRRMISAIGCEEMCGYLWQYFRDICGYSGSGFSSRDGKGSFGDEYYTANIVSGGGYFGDGSHCGSRCYTYAYNHTSGESRVSSRGTSPIIYG